MSTEKMYTLRVDTLALLSNHPDFFHPVLPKGLVDEHEVESNLP